jgi:hypothetical protein
VLDAFEDIRLEPEELLDFGDRLLVTTWMSGHGAGSGIAFRERFFQLYELRDGLVVRSATSRITPKPSEAPVSRSGRCRGILLAGPLGARRQRRPKRSTT